MSIMDMFRTGPKPADPSTQVQQQASAAGNPSVPNGNTPQSSGSGPVAIPPAGTGDTSPLDKFKDLWTADPNQKQQTPGLVPAFNLDSKKLTEAANQMNFMTNVSPELLDKAMKGDAQAFMEVINTSNRMAFATAMAGSGTMLNEFQTRAHQSIQEQIIPGQLRQHEVTQRMGDDNPIFKDPAAAPMLASLAQQLQAKNPTASAEEISKSAKEFLSAFAERVTGKQPQQTGYQGRQPAAETDWEAYFSQR